MAIRLLAGSKNIRTNEGNINASLQLLLTSAARSWLSKLERGTIGSWEELTKQFTLQVNIQAANIDRRSQSLCTTTQ
jgi:hypothetical protein